MGGHVAVDKLKQMILSAFQLESLNPLNLRLSWSGADHVAFIYLG